MTALPKVAFIGTGGTLSSVGRDSLDILDYTATGERLEAEEILSRVPRPRPSPRWCRSASGR